MAKKVIIAEKPSVAKNIADALKIKIKKEGYFEGTDYLVSWAFGHLLQLFDAKDYDASMGAWRMEKFPFIPEIFKYKVKSDMKDRSKPDYGANKQIKLLNSLITRSDVEGVISATDFDREGQIIGDIIIKYLKVEKPVFRLLLNEWTPKEVLKGLGELKANELMLSLQHAGISRQWADWLIGINLTSVATLKYTRGKTKPLNIGRVLLPTLKIIYDRDKEVESFVAKEYFKLTTTFKGESNSEFESIYYINEDEKFNDKKVLQEVKAKLADAIGTITEKQVEAKKEYPPYLFNLSNLQGFITSKNKGWTSDKVLKVAQSLYEKKHITYPRTASSVLEESLVPKAAEVLKLLKTGLAFENEIKFHASKRIFDNSKVESHSAIIPTYLLPKNLSSDEAIVYEAIKNRFLAQFMPLAEAEETRITIKMANNSIDGVFITKGKVQLVYGWKKIEKIQSKDIILPVVSQGEKVNVLSSKITAHKTTAPKYHIEKTLLRVMETCGKKFEDEDSTELMAAILSGFSIGTPATRAETIKKLKDIGFIYSKDKSLLCTDLGKRIVENFPIKELFDLEYTGRLEKTLSEIEKGHFSKDAFMSHINSFVINSVLKIKEDKYVVLSGAGEVKVSEANKSIKATNSPNDFEGLGICPMCQNIIIEGKTAFGCSNWKGGCTYRIQKEDDFIRSSGKKVTKTFIKKFLKDGFINIKDISEGTAKKYEYIKVENGTGYIWKEV